MTKVSAALRSAVTSPMPAKHRHARTLRFSRRLCARGPRAALPFVSRFVFRRGRRDGTSKPTTAVLRVQGDATRLAATAALQQLRIYPIWESACPHHTEKSARIEDTEISTRVLLDVRRALRQKKLRLIPLQQQIQLSKHMTYCICNKT